MDWIPMLIYGATFVVVVMGFVYASRGKTRWGINFSRVSCPNCGAAQPAVRTPKNRQEVMWGGYTCAQCGTKMDKWGRVRMQPQRS